MTPFEKATEAALACIHRTSQPNDPPFAEQLVRAVLGAVREPSDDWIMQKEHLRLDDGEAFTAVIDHILKEARNE